MQLETVDSIVEALRGKPILRPDQFAELMRDHHASHQDSQALARTLIRLRWITIYQAKKIIAGKVDELVIGPYVVLDKLGEGGMGKVFKATQLSLGRVVALKVVRAALLKNETALKRFLREVKAAADLNHPNIVRVFDADQLGNKHFLAMEYIAGCDLAQLVRNRGKLPIDMACSYIRQAALGLQHAHDRKMVHRDIKPSNILVASDPRTQYTARSVAKLLDMGLARIQNDEAAGEHLSTELTRTGTVIGTPDFMSPEQAKNSSAVDHRSDLYSLGCTFYFLLTGEAPFPIGTPLEKLLQHQMDSPKQVNFLRPDVPSEVAGIVQCLLAKRPEDRFQSGMALANALEPWLSLAGTSALLPALVPKAEAVDPISATLELTGDDPFDFDNEESPTPPKPRRPPPLPRPPHREPNHASAPWALIVAVCLVALIFTGVGVGFLLASRDRSAETAPSQEPGKKPSATIVKNDPPVRKELESLEKYLPNDTSLVVLFELKHWRASSAGEKFVLIPLGEKLLSFQKSTGVDLLAAAERVILGIVPDGQPGDVVVIQGRTLVTEKLLEGAKKLPNVTVSPAWPNGPEVYKLGKTQAIFGATSDTSVILSASRERIVEALEKREGSKRTEFSDPSIERGLEKANSRPYAVYATLGVRSGWAGRSAIADDVKYVSLGVLLEERGMIFNTLGEESTPGKIAELQKAFGNMLADQAKKTEPANPILSRISTVLLDAYPPRGGFLGKNRDRGIILQHVVPARRLQDWFAPFVPDSLD